MTLFCRGLCTVFRSRAGNYDYLANLLKSERIKERSQGTGIDPVLHGVDTTACDEEEGNLVDPDPRRHDHNVHWISGESGPSRYVGYFDAASLYPSSGKRAFCFPPPSTSL